MDFVLIPASAAAFTMGSRLGIEDLMRRFGGTEVFYKSEKPFRSVKIGKPFYLLTAPVTQGQWRQVMGDNPSSFKECGDDCPVEMVSWEDAQRFITRLNQMEGSAGYRLPSEAEWEYAARAGSESEFFFGNDAARLGEFAWFSSNSGNRPHPIALKKANPWGLYDMTGNVWEWMEDDWHAGYDDAPADGSARVEMKRSPARVVRGGGWGVAARYCRSSARYYGSPASRTSHVGFRLVRYFTPGL
jgi:formylglycine-generating enzyme required for sulfatase activity